MRRSILLALTACTSVWATGCVGEADGELVHRATFGQATRGLVLHEEGETGHAGMYGTNCPFETRFGTVTGDYDLPDEDEEVQDGGTHELGQDTVLLLQPGRLHLLNKDLRTGVYAHEEVQLPGVVAGRFGPEGVVALVDEVQDGEGCAVSWLAEGFRTPTTGCGAFDVDPVEGTAVVAGDPVQVVTPEGAAPGDASGDLLAVDPASGAIYVATRGEPVVAALEPDGALRWEVELEGRVEALSDGGSRELAVVTLATDAGAVVLLDGLTGEERAWLGTPSAAPGVRVSGDGGTLALVLPEQAHFYGLRVP